MIIKSITNWRISKFLEHIYILNFIDKARYGKISHWYMAGCSGRPRSRIEQIEQIELTNRSWWSIEGAWEGGDNWCD